MCLSLLTLSVFFGFLLFSPHLFFSFNSGFCILQNFFFTQFFVVVFVALFKILACMNWTKLKNLSEDWKYVWVCVCLKKDLLAKQATIYFLSLLLSVAFYFSLKKAKIKHRSSWVKCSYVSNKQHLKVRSTNKLINYEQLHQL